jgi:hypothetical protein
MDLSNTPPLERAAILGAAGLLRTYSARLRDEDVIRWAAKAREYVDDDERWTDLRGRIRDFLRQFAPCEAASRVQ